MLYMNTVCCDFTPCLETEKSGIQRSTRFRTTPSSRGPAQSIFVLRSNRLLRTLPPRQHCPCNALSRCKQRNVVSVGDLKSLSRHSSCDKLRGANAGRCRTEVLCALGDADAQTIRPSTSAIHNYHHAACRMHLLPADVVTKIFIVDWPV